MEQNEIDAYGRAIAENTEKTGTAAAFSATKQQTVLDYWTDVLVGQWVAEQQAKGFDAVNLEECQLVREGIRRGLRFGLPYPGNLGDVVSPEPS